jgi:hypothetical protein
MSINIHLPYFHPEDGGSRYCGNMDYTAYIHALQRSKNRINININHESLYSVTVQYVPL